LVFRRGEVIDEVLFYAAHSGPTPPLIGESKTDALIDTLLPL